MTYVYFVLMRLIIAWSVICGKKAPSDICRHPLTKERQHLSSREFNHNETEIGLYLLLALYFTYTNKTIIFKGRNYYV